MKKILIIISLLFTALLFTEHSYAMPKPTTNAWEDVTSSIYNRSYNVNQSRFAYIFYYDYLPTYDYIITFQGSFDNTIMFNIFGNNMINVRIVDEFSYLVNNQTSYSLDGSLNLWVVPFSVNSSETSEFIIEISIKNGNDLGPSYHAQMKTTLDTNLKIYRQINTDGMGVYINDLNSNTYNEAYKLGINVGYDNGYSNGYQLGYGVGYQIARDLYDLDYQAYYDSGYTLGYNEGYTVGFDVGFDSELDFENVLSWVFMPFTILSREIAFGITIGHLAMIPIVFGLMGFLFSLKKGKK